MTTRTTGPALGPVPDLPRATGRKAVWLGAYTYIPAPVHRGAVTGLLARETLPVTLRAAEGVLQQFMDAMSALERDLARRWTAMETLPCRSRAE